MKRAAAHLFKRQSKNRTFSKLSNFYVGLRSPGADPRARQRSENPTPGATRMWESPRVFRGDGQAWNWLILCSYWPIVRSILENIRTEVLKYGPNEVRSVRKAEVRIFSRMDSSNWSIRALLYRHNQRPKPSLNSVLNMFVSSLNAPVGREIFSSSHISFKIKF